MQSYNFSKPKQQKFKTTDFSQSEADRLLASIMNQCKKNNKDYYKEPEEEKQVMIVQEKKNEDKANIKIEKVYSSNRNLHLAIKRIVETFGGTEKEAHLAIENARSNPDVKYPLRYVTASRESFIVNLEQANKKNSSNAEIKRQQKLF